jgi:hypothetical protein
MLFFGKYLIINPDMQTIKEGMFTDVRNKQKK